MEGANLTGADLAFAILDRVEILGPGGKRSGRYITPNLTGAILRGANLTQVDVAHIDLSTADVTGAKLDGLG